MSSLDSNSLPAPLTPPECDLRGNKWLPLFGAKLYSSDFDAKASDAEFRAAQKLWWEAWNQVPAGSLPDDDAVLCKLAGLGRDIETWQKLRVGYALYGFSKCSDGRLYHKFLAAEALIAWDTLNALASVPEDQNQANGDLIAWWQNRNNELKLLNRDNSVFEDGSATMKGSELLVPGKYMKLTRGALTSTSYVVQVDHNFMPFQGWTSTVQFIRGDGFLVRDKYAGNPFWAEGRQGPYAS